MSALIMTSKWYILWSLIKSITGFFNTFHFKCVFMSNYLDTSIYLFSQKDKRTDIETKDLWSF